MTPTKMTPNAPESDRSTDNGMDDDNRPLDLLVSSDDDDVDDEAGDLLVVPVSTTYKVNHGKEEIYELSHTMGMF